MKIMSPKEILLGFFVLVIMIFCILRYTIPISLSTSQEISHIITKVKAGNEPAFRQLFDLYYKDLLKSAYIMLKDLDTAKEAVQLAFVGLWNNKENLDPQKSVKAYLGTATRTRALNLIKSKAHHSGVGDEPLVYQPAEHGDPERSLNRKEQAQQIKKAVDGLPPKCRNVFVLAKYEGHTHKEIAQMLDISPKTVEHQVARAMRLLRKSLNDFYYNSILWLFIIGELLN